MTTLDRPYRNGILVSPHASDPFGLITLYVPYAHNLVPSSGSKVFSIVACCDAQDLALVAIVRAFGFWTGELCLSERLADFAKRRQSVSDDGATLGSEEQ